MKCQTITVLDLGDVWKFRARQQQQDGREGEWGGPVAPLGQDHQRVGYVVKEEAATDQG